MRNLKVDYDEISPITGNFCVMVETLEDGSKSYICMESGYCTNDYFKVDSEVIQNHERGISQLMIDVKHIDEQRNLVWYPIYMQVKDMTVYCTGTDKSDIVWNVAGIVELNEENKKDYLIPGETDKYYEYQIDVNNAEVYTSFNDAIGRVYEIALNNL
jgi:hypothetical protein